MPQPELRLRPAAHPRRRELHRAARQGDGAHGRLGRRQDHGAAPDRRPGRVRSAAQVLFDGEIVAALRPRRPVRACAAAWACCSSSARCSPICRVFENVAFPLREHTDLPESLIRDIVLMKLNAVGLRGAARPDAQRDLGRHGAPRGARARDRARPGADHVRRAVRRPRPDLAGHRRQPDPHAERHARRHQRSSCRTTCEETLRDRRPRVSAVANGRIAAQGTPAELRGSDDPLVHQFVHARAGRPGAFPLSRPAVAEDFGAGSWPRMSWLRVPPTSASPCARELARRSAIGARCFVRPAARLSGRRCAAPAWCATRSTSSATTRW